MPTGMWRLAPAAGTASPATAATAAAASAMRLHTYRLPTERLEHPAQTLVELDLGLPAEDLLRAGDVGLAHMRVVDRQGLVDDLALRAGDAQHLLGELVERELARVAEVHRQVLARLGEQDEAADQVVDVAEAPRLRPVAEDGDRLPLERLPHEGG